MDTSSDCEQPIASISLESQPSPNVSVNEVELSIISSPSVHQNPNWLKELKKNMFLEIIDPCSARTKSAVRSDKYIVVSKLNLMIQYSLF